MRTGDLSKDAKFRQRTAFQACFCDELQFQSTRKVFRTPPILNLSPTGLVFDFRFGIRRETPRGTVLEVRQRLIGGL